MELRRTGRPAGSTFSSSPLRVERAGAGAIRPRPKKSLGQHFLTDQNIIRRIVDAADVSPGGTVIEIGAGPGDLTAELASRGANVLAVELDQGLCAWLRQRFAGAGNVTILEADALRLDVRGLVGLGEKYVAVGNLPYNVGTAIVRHLLESEPRPERLVVMLQKEVAEAMLARPGGMSLLSAGMQVYATGRRLFDVAAGSFVPPPKVKSSVVRLEVRPGPLVPDAERERFFEVVRAGFSAPRKQLRNSLANGLGIGVRESEEAIRQANLDPARRPQELSIEEWLRLARSVDE